MCRLETKAVFGLQITASTTHRFAQRYSSYHTNSPEHHHQAEESVRVTHQ